MKKTIFILALVAYTSCKNRTEVLSSDQVEVDAGQNPINAAQNTEVVDTIEEVNELVSVNLDSGVIGFYLGRVQRMSADKMTNPALNGYYRTGIGETYVLNSDSSQVLCMITQSGDTKGSFAEFKLRSRKPEENLTNMCPTLYDEFKTTFGIVLGDSISEVERLLPAEFTTRVNENSRDVRLELRLEGMNAYKYLRFHNVPVYFGKYEFENGKLVSYHFGFEYP